MIGVIGGPIGMLFGWTGGLLVGGAFDIRRADRSDSVLGEISRYIPLGGTAVVAEVDEYAVEVVDKLMTELGGTVYRRPAERGARRARGGRGRLPGGAEGSRPGRARTAQG